MRGTAGISATSVLLALCLGASSTAREVSTPDVLVSRQLADALHLEVGDTIRLAAKPKGAQAQPFRIAGFYEPAPDPMRLNALKHEVRLHLPDLLSMTANPSDPLGMERVDAINLLLASGVDAQAFSHDLNARIPGIIAQPTQGASPQAGTFVVLERFHFAIAIVTILASTVFLLALTVMLVDERRETIGILRLIGVSRGRILEQVFIEGLLIAVAGALFGLVLAVASEGLINRYFQWRYDTALVFVHVTSRVALRSVLIAVPLGAIASVAASWALLRRSVLALARR